VTARRLPIPLLLLALILVAFVAGDPDTEGMARARDPREAVAVPPEGTTSSGWFCPGPPPTLPIEQEFLALTNVSEADETVVVTVYPDGGEASVRREVDIAALSVTRVARVDMGPPGPVTVEAFSRDVVVESGFESAERVAMNPCASTAAKEWHFAAGTTVRGTEQYLMVFNPLGTDAKVDVTIRTGERVLEPEDLQSLDIPRRTRIPIAVHNYAIRSERVAIDLESTIGNVVVEQSIVFNAESGFQGVTRSMGVLAPAASWTFADGNTVAGTSTVVALSNPGAVDVEVDVYANVGIEVPVTPVTAVVPRGGVTWVALGRCPDPVPEGCLAIPPESEYALQVESDAKAPIVAEVLTLYDDTVVGSGAATVMGTADPADRWIVTRSVVPDARVVLALTNPAIRAVTVDVDVIVDGSIEQPDELQGITIEPGRRAGVEITTLVGPDATLVVHASAAIVVERSVYAAGDLSRSPAIPARGGS